MDNIIYFVTFFCFINSGDLFTFRLPPFRWKIVKLYIYWNWINWFFLFEWVDWSWEVDYRDMHLYFQGWLDEKSISKVSNKNSQISQFSFQDGKDGKHWILLLLLNHKGRGQKLNFEFHLISNSLFSKFLPKFFII